MDLSTPNSHMESLMLAETVITSWKAPKMKQMELVIKLKNVTIFIECSISSAKLLVSNRIRFLSSITESSELCSLFRSVLVAVTFVLMKI